MPAEPIRLCVNGRVFAREVEPRRHLADFLRHDLGLTGTHIGCEHGACGACTVLLDGAPVRACLLFAVQADGTEVTTVEGLAGEGGALHPLQAAFRSRHGLQCGFCTPGMLMTLTAFLTEHPDAGEHAVRDAISGNLCRCTGYESIVDAALEAAREMRRA
jgi:carbon-monoxide dehydrogenase small subunit